jgi:uncharacterized protein YbjT (DUF2867 family)
MARVLIVAGGCRGLRLAGTLVGDGHAVRVTTRGEQGRAAIEATGAECWIGDPDRISTLRDSLERVTIVCWLLGTASGSPDAVAALHGTRLEHWLTRVIDTTVRGFVYEASGSAGAPLLASGERLVRAACALNAIPLAVLNADPADEASWQRAAQASVELLLAGPGRAR